MYAQHADQEIGLERRKLCVCACGVRACVRAWVKHASARARVLSE